MITKFGERLLQAARHVGVGESQSEIADALGMSRQTVHHWFTKGFPTVENLRIVREKWGINTDWLTSGEGTMLADPAANDLPTDELELLRDYRKASHPARENIRRVARALRKSVLTIAAVIPPLLASSEGDASVLHNTFSALNASVIHIACQRLFAALRQCFKCELHHVPA